MTHERLLLVVLLTIGMGGCTMKATIDTTTDGTTEFASSTTGKTWWTEEGLVKNGEHAGAFVSVNYENLLRDIATGEGEYLQAFGKVLHVPTVHQHAFANQLQQHYADLANIKVQHDEGNVRQFIYRVGVLTGQSSASSL